MLPSVSKQILSILAIAWLSFQVAGCAAPIIIGAAAVGATMAHDRRAAGVQVDDDTIEIKASARISDNPDIATHASVGVTSYNRIVLLTGQVDDPYVKERIVRMTQDVPQVRRVVDEILVGDRASLQRSSEDAYITSRVKIALVEIRRHDFDPTRIKVVTEKGVVFLMGIVTPEEAEATVQKARYVSGVRRVVKVFEYL